MDVTSSRPKTCGKRRFALCATVVPVRFRSRFWKRKSDETGHPRFREALSVARYFLDNTFLATDEDALFFRAVENLVKKYEATDSDYWDFAGKTPIPMQDYLKVIYDLRK